MESSSNPRPPSDTDINMEELVLDKVLQLGCSGRCIQTILNPESHTLIKTKYNEIEKNNTQIKRLVLPAKLVIFLENKIFYEKFLFYD